MKEPRNKPSGAFFDRKHVDIDIAFIESLTLTKTTKSGRPEPFTLLPVHRELIENLLGWKRPDGTRLYRKCYFSLARKNAKTQIAAAIALVMLVLDNELQPEIYIAAKDREQASLCFYAIADMIHASPDLSDILAITPSTKTIINRQNGGKLKALSSEGKSKHGLNPSCVIFDELHSWTSSEQELYDALTTGSGLRRQPLFLTITTAGIDEHSICGKQYEYACKVRDGVVDDPAFLPLIFEVPKDADWTDETLWPLANPTLGALVKLDDLRAERETALKIPAEQTKFRRLFLNQWVNAKDVWISLHHFDACKWDGETSLPIAA
jgi:phage terminase large subunit-like protein